MDQELEPVVGNINIKKRTITKKTPNQARGGSNSVNNLSFSTRYTNSFSNSTIPSSFIKRPANIRRQIKRSRWNLVYLIRRINWLHTTIILFLPIVGSIVSLLFQVPITENTLRFTIFYYFLTSLCVTSGYHRLWAHRSFEATKVLSLIYAVFGAATGLGSIKKWVARHRAHHRYTDTERDPHNARRSLIYSHMGWMIFKPNLKISSSITELLKSDDLSNDAIINWQEQNYIILFVLTSMIIPAAVAGYFWNDYKGGLLYSGIIRCMLNQQTSFTGNSLCHYVGTQPYDDKKTPRNNWFLTFLTFGEGFQNFHHNFPNDYRIGIHWYEFDLTRFQIEILYKIGLIKSIKKNTNDAINQCIIQQNQKILDRHRAKLNWGVPIKELPIISENEFKRLVKTSSRALLIISGVVHDVTPIINTHPGGSQLVRASIGKDATTAFEGGVYAHSNAAHNLLATMRVAIIYGFHIQNPSNQLKIATIRNSPSATAGAA
ncbi:acyl-CoA desaturase [Ascoidea rubescens DSM 1968]|uniref:Acyl-CoA desaturase n=1 Tax=Ascoidea rubescens DSM 1968 TaxID=1344418 RepID=A0A1D2VQK3_9ASCO|nr:delta(9) fatty acid desaturase [Ascoidea rubescens DSM 1968]ODV63879.1 delta(9) fatty acid desaturase [Ascoidea rubescens DSM 1968]